jgi:hypothetical protein
MPTIQQHFALLQKGAWKELDDSWLQGERSRESWFPLPVEGDDDWGRSESLDPDNVGDIADEGAGHRG